MSGRRYLHCRDCNAVHHVTPFDTAPLFIIDGDQVREIPRDDRRQFLERHSSHAIHELVAIDEERGANSDFTDPMKARYIEVIDGREFLTLRVFRESITDPLTYAALPCQLQFGSLLEAVTATRRDRPKHHCRRKRNPPQKQPIDYSLFGFSS